jgi:endonuclease YncB( thermonuclease family)
MKKKHLFAALAAAFFCSAFAQTITGQVVGVADGDTITILEVQNGIKAQRKIRISGIDAPEKSQAFGAASDRSMGGLAFDRTATATCHGKDRYERYICTVYVNGIDVGLRQIETGMAWHYKKYAGTQPREEAAAYSLSEEIARSKKEGLWRDLGTAAPPMPPWEWRGRKAP